MCVQQFLNYFIVFLPLRSIARRLSCLVGSKIRKRGVRGHPQGRRVLSRSCLSWYTIEWADRIMLKLQSTNFTLILRPAEYVFRIKACSKTSFTEIDESNDSEFQVFFVNTIYRLSLTNLVKHCQPVSHLCVSVLCVTILIKTLQWFPSWVCSDNLG